MKKDNLKRRKSIGFLPKILFHIVAISLFMFGCVILHSFANSKTYSSTMLFFGTDVEKSVVFDIGILCIAIGFFIEFFFTFYPIYILKKKR